MNIYGKVKPENKDRAVIIGGGRIDDYTYIKSLINNTDYIICADSGYDHSLKLCVDADLCIGDFDSAKQMPPVELKRVFPAKKDLTDTELALAAAREIGFKNFLFVAVTGTRFDHTLANIMLLKTCDESGETACIANENNTLYVFGHGLKTIEFNLPDGQIVSLVPLSNCFGVTTTGLEYPLVNAELGVGTSLGISNTAVNENIAISVAKGCLLVVLAKD